jgi:hypothetical protein
VNHLARLVARYSTNLTVAALRSPDGFHEEKYVQRALLIQM